MPTISPSPSPSHQQEEMGIASISAVERGVGLNLSEVLA